MIGDLLAAKGEFDDALDEYRRCLMIRLATLGDTDPAVADTFYAIASAMLMQGYSLGVQEVFQKALDIRESVLDATDPLIATTATAVGTAHMLRGDYPAALVEYWKALALREDVLGKLEPDTAQAYGNIGSVLYEQGALGAALLQCRKCLTIHEMKLGSWHPAVAAARNSVGCVLAERGDHDDALDEFQKALKVIMLMCSLGVGGLASPYRHVGLRLCSLCPRCHRVLHRALIAVSATRCICTPTPRVPCSKVFETVLGGSHPAVATVHGNIGSVLMDQGDAAKALVSYQTGLAIELEALDDHPATATSFYSIAVALHLQGKLAESLTAHRKALEIREEMLGGDHPDTVSSRGWVTGLTNSHTN